MKFNELSKEAKDKAILDYIKGWEDTHDNGDMSYSEAASVMLDNPEDEYTPEGEYIEIDDE